MEGLKKAEMDLWPTTGAAFRFPEDLLAMTAVALKAQSTQLMQNFRSHYDAFGNYISPHGNLRPLVLEQEFLLTVKCNSMFSNSNVRDNSARFSLGIYICTSSYGRLIIIFAD